MHGVQKQKPSSLKLKTQPDVGALEPDKGLHVTSELPWQSILRGESPSSSSWQFPLWLLTRPPAFESPWDFAWVSMLLILPVRNPRLLWTSSLRARPAARAVLLLHVSTGGTVKLVCFQGGQGSPVFPLKAATRCSQLCLPYTGILFWPKY